MGGTCKWVIVSNIIETRFYIANDSTKYQAYLLEDLINEEIIKELLFLFHKDRFIKKEVDSQTDRLLSRVKLKVKSLNNSTHIIDKLYNCIKKFKGLGFVDPNYLAKIYPFNILDEHVWHYQNRNLFTLNSEIHELLTGIEIKNSELIISESLSKEIETSNVIDAKNKLESTLKFLNNCMIQEISAIKDYKQISKRKKNAIGFSYLHSFDFEEGDEGVTKDVFLLSGDKCECLSCKFRTLDFKGLLEKIKSNFGNEKINTSEYAFGNYLIASNNYKSAYNILKSIEKETKGKEGKEIQYFLSKLNIKYLHNLISDYQYADRKEILNDIKSIDLDKVIYDEIEFSVDKEVKNYLIGIKEDKLIHTLQDKIDLKLKYKDLNSNAYKADNLMNNLETFLLNIVF